MPLITDLHIHSKYARGCSKDLDLPNLEKYARIKGIDLLGTGDFTHPKWIAELKAQLTEDGSGILRTKSGYPFMLTSEISMIFSQGGKGRRVHNIILAPSFSVVDQVTAMLLKRGRVDYDGRPVFGMSCVELVDEMQRIDPCIEIIPAHAWTPWFAIFGSKSGFDSLQECFQERTKNIHAIETGMSSDPLMNWRISALDTINLVSFSDSHSYWPFRLGREATLFDLDAAPGERTYDAIIHAIRTGERLAGTVETDPNYGKYHFDGHRACGVRFTPEETKKHAGICPKCKKPLTIGVEYRIEELADRPAGFKPVGAKPFQRLLPLQELLGGIYGAGIVTKAVWGTYYRLLKAFGTEFAVLRDIPELELARVVDPKIAALIMQNRRGEIAVDPGYDGEYGKPQITALPTAETREPVRTPQRSLADFGEK